MIIVENLIKEYKIPCRDYKRNLKNFFITPTITKYGLNDISFEIGDGEIVGLVGLNGAGKTTLIKTLSGILTPTSGNVSVLGMKPSSKRKIFTPNIGVVMGQKSILYYDLPVIDSYKFYKEVYGISKEKFYKRIQLFSDTMQIDELLHIPVRKLSLGQRMKCEIGASLLHEPKVIFLDEPTLGLDIVTKKSILNLLKELNNNERVSMILTTHDIEDINSLCKRIIILDQGKIAYDGETSTLCSRDQYKLVTIEYENEIDMNDITKYISNIKAAESHKVTWKVKTKHLLNLLQHLREQEEKILDIEIQTVSLSEAMYEYYAK